MPKSKGYSRKVVSANIAEMVDAGYAKARAEAAALNRAREEYFRRYPNGQLPIHLKLPDGKRTKRAFASYRRKHNPAVGGKFKNAAANILVKIYRAKGENEAQKRFDEIVLRANLTLQDEKEIQELFKEKLKKVDPFEFVEYSREGRKRNPVPPSKRSIERSRESRIKAASRLYTQFTGHEADEFVEVDKPVMPDVMLVIGDVDGILYTTVRDGNEESYIHEFEKKCRPLFCVAPDGKALFILGGSYDFTERGIVDRT